MLTEQNVHKSRWGYHPCDYDTYEKLKRLHALYHLSLRYVAKMRRWERKAPQNRTIKMRAPGKPGGRNGYDIVGPMPRPETCSLFGQEQEILASNGVKFIRWTYNNVNIGKVIISYQRARHPVPEKDDVVAITLSEKEINDFLEEAEQWYQKITV